MDNQWQSAELHEHPATHQKGVYGHVCLSTAGVYYMQVGSFHISCPQGWAAKVHQREVQGKAANSV